MSAKVVLFVCTLFLMSSSILKVSCHFCRKVACNPPWLVYSEHCYLFVTAKKSFDDAEAYCQNYAIPGSSCHLTSIENAAENEFIRAYVSAVDSREFWIGYNDRRVHKYYQWTDGSSTRFHKWRRDEPNGGRDCVSVSPDQGKWSDNPCHISRSFVCKAPKMMDPMCMKL